MSDETYGMPRIRVELVDAGVVTSRMRIAVLMRASGIASVSRRRSYSDQSSQYISVIFGKRCAEMGVRPSMGTVGDAYCNAMVENFFATLECELIDRKSWKTYTDALHAIFTWIEAWYNPKHRHSSINHISPIELERKH